MTEISKMYKNAGIKPQYKKRTECKDGYTVGHPCEKGIACINCNRSVFEDVMPPFTAEKQLEIIKLISKQGQVIIENWEKDNKGFNVTFRANSNLRYITMDCITRKTVEEALAQIINDIWQDLTSEEKEKIRGILNAR